MTITNDAEIGVRPGDIVAGKYRVERVLGHGGMGVVVSAHHLRLDEKVALKLLHPDALTRPDAIARFVREARTAARIKSEHVARVTDVGELDSGAPYIVMEYLEGSDLADWLVRFGPMPIEQAAEFVLQACEAVAEAHALGIIHRDLKPANLFCARRAAGQPTIKVLDFGISKPGPLEAGWPGGVTTTTSVMGSPHYMSPEQMQSAKALDGQSDIWSLGVVLYELLTAHVPFEGGAATEIAIKVAMQPPPPIDAYRPDVPPGLQAVIQRCLEKERHARYRDVAEFAAALAEFAPPQARGSVERITRTLKAGGAQAQAPLDPAAPLAVRAEPPGSVSATLPLPRRHGRRPESPHTAAPAGQTAVALPVVMPPRRSSVRVAVATGLTLGAVGTVAIAVALHRRPSPPLAPRGEVTVASPPPQASATAADVLASTEESSPSAALRGPDAPVPSATAVTPLSSTAALPPRTKSRAVPAAGRSSGGAARSAASRPLPPSPTSASAPGPNCSPPYTIDSGGFRQYKPECL
jgi:serine/threonine-protein kinase